MDTQLGSVAISCPAGQQKLADFGYHLTVNMASITANYTTARILWSLIV